MQETLAENAGKHALTLPFFPRTVGGLYPEDQSQMLLHGKARQPCLGLWGATLSLLSTVPSLPLLSVLLWGALRWAGSLPDWAWGTETFTLGVLGPWDCDFIFAQALPSVAAQLAVDRPTRTAH